ncbi:TonB-dependent receptor [Seonamhaeicola sp.]|uniref:SusC/RagA family TonB-linked outer membrane protein n=1 Tax=Seonamhaeicola sp. TaxID=1912245 RepID=UPI00260FE5E9|nr:TonB-dependent receptor [Seonamhaeicola sp.]
MKKLLNGLVRPFLLLKFDLKMKLSSLFIIITAFGLHANSSYSQRTKISLDFDNISIGQLIDEIESTTEFRFIYKIKDVDLDRILSIKVKKKQIGTILAEMFSTSETDYNVIDRQIFLTKKIAPDIPKKVGDVIETLPQEIVVSGTVTDESNQPLIGANVLVKGTTTGVATDFDGNYSIKVNQGDVLIFSYTGFLTQEVTVGTNTTINIQLVEDAQSLEEVILIGYGSRKKTDVVSAVSKVDNDFIEQQPGADATRALQGSASGVTVVASARPGQQAQVRIRGIGSINGNNPLYVVDGVIGAALPPPAQIESIQVLKDASSTAIYGARGASGVILVKTKTGRKEQAAKVEFNVRTGVGVNNAKYDFMTDPELIGQMIWLEQTNDGIPVNHAHFQFDPNDIFGTTVNDYLFPNGASIGDPAADPSLYVERDYPITLTNKNGTDWLDEIYNSALLQDYTISVSGGSKKTTYAMSGNFFNEEGVFKYTGFERYAFRSNVDSELTDWLTIGQRLGVTLSESSGNSSSFNSIIVTSPLIPVRDIAGNFAGGIVGGNLNDGPNPLGVNFRERRDLRKTLNVNGNFSVEVKPIKDLRVKSLFGYNMSWFSNHNPRFGDPENTNGTEVNSLSEVRSNFTTWNWSNTLSYSKTIDEKHSFDILVGAEATQNEFDEISAGRAGFVATDEDFYELSAGADNVTNGSRTSEGSLFSIFSRLFYSYDSKYMIEGTVRRDGSSNFLEANKYATFPAVSAGWVISKEPFMENTGDWLRQLKLRAGWGQSGNDNVGGSLNGYTTFGSGLGNSYYGITGSDNTISLGYQSITKGNPDAVWETTETTNFGLDATLAFGLDLSIDVWDKTTRDLLFPVAIPDVEGIARAPFVNIGDVENKGLDIELNFNKQVNEDFRYSIGLNVTTYKNKVLNLSDNPDEFISGRVQRSQTYTRAQAGRAFPEFFGYVVDGIFQTQAEADAHPANGSYNEPGNLKIRDVDGDGEITPDDRTWIGNPHPDFTAGLNLGFNYKNFDLSMIWYTSVGNDLLNYYGRFTRYGLFQGPKSKDRLFRSWGSPYLNDNADAVLPKASSSTSFEQNTHSDMIEDGSFLRMKNIQIGYNVPQPFLDKFGLSDMRLYIMGTNLITLFDDYSGLDVEIAPPTFPLTEIDRGFDLGTWPTPKQFIFGLNISM